MRAALAALALASGCGSHGTPTVDDQTRAEWTALRTCLGGTRQGPLAEAEAVHELDDPAWKPSACRTQATAFPDVASALGGTNLPSALRSAEAAVGEAPAGGLANAQIIALRTAQLDAITLDAPLPTPSSTGVVAFGHTAKGAVQVQLSTGSSGNRIGPITSGAMRSVDDFSWGARSGADHTFVGWFDDSGDIRDAGRIDFAEPGRHALLAVAGTPQHGRVYLTAADGKKAIALYVADHAPTNQIIEDADEVAVALDATGGRSAMLWRHDHAINAVVGDAGIVPLGTGDKLPNRACFASNVFWVKAGGYALRFTEDGAIGSGIALPTFELAACGSAGSVWRDGDHVFACDNAGKCASSNVASLPKGAVPVSLPDGGAAMVAIHRGVVAVYRAGAAPAYFAAPGASEVVSAMCDARTLDVVALGPDKVSEIVRIPAASIR